MEYLVNEQGERTRVVLTVEEYEELVDAREELEDQEHIQAARETLARVRRGEEEVVPWEQAKREVREGKV